MRPKAPWIGSEQIDGSIARTSRRVRAFTQSPLATDTESVPDQNQRRDYLDLVMRWGIPRRPLWWKLRSFAVSASVLGVLGLIIGLISSDRFEWVSGLVFLGLAQLSALAGARLRPTDHVEQSEGQRSLSVSQAPPPKHRR
jgi:hypothetical protein